jgi:hypothetical protein
LAVGISAANFGSLSGKILILRGRERGKREKKIYLKRGKKKFFEIFEGK